MAKKEYIANTRSLTPLPRSKRLRGAVDGVASASIIGAVASGTGESITEQQVADIVIRICTQRYLSRIEADEALDLIKFAEGLTSGSFVEGESGARIDGLGNGEFESLVVRSLIEAAKTITDALEVKGTAKAKNLTVDETTKSKNLIVDEKASTKNLDVSEKTTTGTLETGSFVEGESGARIDGLGNGELESLVVRLKAVLGELAVKGGSTFGDYSGGKSGASIDVDGNAEFGSLLARIKAELQELQVNGTSTFGDTLSSPDFVSGFVNGRGWALMKEIVYDALGLPTEKYTLEVDDLVVRNSLKVYEFVISQLLGENDNRVFTAMLEVDHYDHETGRVWMSTQGGKFYNPFRPGDYVMVQQYNGMPDDVNDGYITKQYEFVVEEVGLGSMEDGADRLDWLTFSSFTSPRGLDPEQLIAEGDTLVRVDNATDEDRKGLIQITSVGTATPYIDIVHGLKTDPDNALKGRLGNLQGIRHPLFGWLQGFGEYLSNLYAVGDFRLSRTGDSIDTQLEILKNRFASQYSAILYDITEEDNMLYNATFTGNLDGWEAVDSASVIFDEYGEAYLLNGDLIVSDSERADIQEYEGTDMLYLCDSKITQRNALITQPSTHLEYDDATAEVKGWEANVSGEINEKGVEKPDTLYLTVRFLAKTSGTLTIGFTGSAGGQGALPSPAMVAVEADTKWQTMQWQGTWNGLGDFTLGYTGRMYVAQLSLTSNPLEDFRKEVTTKIIQTANNISLLGSSLDAKAGRIADLGIELSALDGRITLWVNETDTKLGGIDSEIEAVKEAQVQIQADMIDMEVSLKQDITDATGELSKRIESAEVTIEAQGVTIEANRTNIDALTGRIETAESSIEVSAGKIELLSTSVEDLRTTSGSTFAELRNSLEGLSGEIDSVNADLSAGISDLMNDIKGINTSINGMNTVIWGMDSRMTEFGVSLYGEDGEGGLMADVTKIFGDIDSMLDELKDVNDTIELHQSAIVQNAADIKLRVTTVAYDAFVESTQGDIEELKTDYTALSETALTLEEGLASLSTTLAEQYTTTEGITTMLSSAGFLTTADAATIYATKTEMTTAIDDATGTITEAYWAAIQVEADRITSLVTRTESVEDTLENHYALIEQNADSISLKVSANEVISAINLSPEEITIDAKKITLEGYTSINNTFVVSKSGEVSITGKLTAQTLDLSACTHYWPMNGSVVTNEISNSIMYLPNLGEGVIRTIKFYLPVTSRAVGDEVRVAVREDNSFIRWVDEQGIRRESKQLVFNTQSGLFFELIGMGHGEMTEWVAVFYASQSPGFITGD